MNDKVYVKIRGLSAQEAGDAYKEAEDIEIISVGRYTRRAGKVQRNEQRTVITVKG